MNRRTIGNVVETVATEQTDRKLASAAGGPPPGRDLFVASDIGEELLAILYLMLKEDGLLSWVFYQEEPSLSTFLSWLNRPASRFLGCFLRPNPSPTLDLQGAKDPLDRSFGRDEEGAERSQSNRPGGPHTEHLAPGRRRGAGIAQDGSPIICGLGWLWNVGGVPGAMKADMGMVFLRRFWDPSLTREWTSQMLDYSFGQMGLDVLFGGVPADNRLALSFAKRMGFEHTQRLPKFAHRGGNPVDIVIQFMTREMWNELR